MEHIAWYLVENIDEIDSPALLIYNERINENIKTIKNDLPSVSVLRPHVKTHKSSDITKLFLNEGIQKFKCATISEVEMLGALLVPDVLLAYQPVGPKVNRLVSLIKKYNSTEFSCLIDNLEAAKDLSKTAIDNSIILNVYLDINIGMNRTGVLPGTNAAELYKECLNLKGIRIIGLHAYDGHINDKDFKERKIKCDSAFDSLEKTKNLLYQINKKDLKIVVGGSPTFPIHVKRDNVECSPGTFIFWDKGYKNILQEQDFVCGALIATRIISLLDETTACIDLGHKAIASEMPLAERAIFLNAPDATIKSHSEEHMTINISPDHSYKIGDVLYAVPHHICPTVALYNKMALVSKNRVANFWEVTARERNY
jgi:D-serine deaminase-like pyridoxal phosphate-dependent protein